MICPVCHAPDCRRSRRRSATDFFVSIVGSVPWRCMRCSTRFRTRSSTYSNLLCAHCPICCNLELKRITPELVAGLTSPIWRLLGVPAFRCIPCRHKFFTLLPLSKEVHDTEYKIAS